MRWVVHIEELRNICRIFVVKPQRKRELGIPRRRCNINIAIILLKAGIWEPEKTSIVGQRLGKRVSATMSNYGSTAGNGVFFWGGGLSARLYDEEPRPAELMSEE